MFSLPHRLRKRGIAEYLREEYGLAVAKTAFAPAVPVEFEGQVLKAAFQASRNAEYLRLVIEGGPFLPEPLRIDKRAEKNFPAFMKDEDPGIALADCEAFGRIGGQGEKTGELASLLEAVRRRSSALLIKKNVIASLIPIHYSQLEKLKEAATAAVACASLLSEIGKSADLSLPLLSFIAHEGMETGERKKAVGCLVSLHRGAALTKETLSALMKGPDFDLGLTAADGLGVEPLHYCRFCLESLPPADAARAVRVFLRNEVPGAEAYLIERFHGTREPAIRTAIVAALAERPSAAAIDLFIEALDGKRDDAHAYAIAALGEHGDDRALAALYRLAKDEAAPPVVREQADAAIAAIRSRLGDVSDGRLSLARGAPAGEGGLSRAEGGRDQSEVKDKKGKEKKRKG